VVTRQGAAEQDFSANILGALLVGTDQGAASAEGR